MYFRWVPNHFGIDDASGDSHRTSGSGVHMSEVSPAHSWFAYVDSCWEPMDRFAMVVA